MTAWKTKSLSNVVSLQRGHDLPTDERIPGTIPIIGSFGITGYHNTSKQNGPGVTIGRSGASIGKATYVKNEFWPLNTCLFATNFHGNDPFWVYLMLSQINFSGFNSGSAQPSLNRNIIAGIPVVVPPLPEQQAIAEVLRALDDKIAANRKLVTTGTDLGCALIRRALTTSTVTSLSELADITMGSSPKGDTYNEDGQGIVMYQGNRDFGPRFPSPRIWTTDPVRVAETGDLLLSVRAPVGELNIAGNRCCIGRGLAAIHAAQPCAMYFLISCQPEVFYSYNSDGTIFGSITKKGLESLPLKVPNIGLAPLEELLAPLEDRIEAAVHESETLAQLRNTLLPALMDGTIRVKDAEKKAEEVL